MRIYSVSSAIANESRQSPIMTEAASHLWLNALLTRLFWDFVREAKWRRLLVEKIQKKLGKMHLPYFMDKLVVSEMDLGTSMPELVGAGSPYLDAQGLWVKLQVRSTDFLSL